MHYLDELIIYNFKFENLDESFSLIIQTIFFAYTIKRKFARELYKSDFRTNAFSRLNYSVK